jgi:hypothetical protein
LARTLARNVGPSVGPIPAGNRQEMREARVLGAKSRKNAGSEFSTNQGSAYWC